MFAYSGFNHIFVSIKLLMELRARLLHSFQRKLNSRFKLTLMQINLSTSELPFRLYCLIQSAYLEVPAFAVGCVDEIADFKFLDCESKDPVFGDAPGGFESVPARQWPEAIQICQWWGRHIHVNIDRLVAMIIDGLCWH